MRSSDDSAGPGLSVRWKQGGRYNVSAETAQNEFEKIAELPGGLTAPNVVKVARDPKNPLHGEFEWDDSAAGEKYRESQARCMLRSVVKIAPEMPQKPIRAYQAVEVNRDESPKEYVETRRVMREPELRAQILATAKRELQSFRAKYRDLTELASVFDAIDGLGE